MSPAAVEVSSSGSDGDSSDDTDLAGLIDVHTLDGRTVTLALGADHSRIRVCQLKACLAENLGMPMAEMRLVWGAQVLRDFDVVSTLPCSEVGAEADMQALQVTLLRASRLPAFLERKCLDDVNERAPDGSTALHLAASEGDAALCLEVLREEEFSEVDAEDFLGNTALHQAAGRGLRVVCAEIMRHPRFRNVGARNTNGRTALHIAALRADYGTCKAILAHPKFSPGCLAAQDALGNTAAELAEDAGELELAQTLRACSS